VGQACRPLTVAVWVGSSDFGHGGSVRFESFSFGSIQIASVVYEHDPIIDRGKIRRRRKRASEEYRAAYGHTHVSHLGQPA